jgi:hypothetical protein
MSGPLWFVLIALQVFHLLLLLLTIGFLGNLNNVSGFQKSTTAPQKVLGSFYSGDYWPRIYTLS